MKDSVVSQKIQDSFVLLCITNTEFLRIVRGCVHSTYFSSQITEDVINICYSYFDQFKESPQDHFHDELVRFLRDKDNNKKDQYVTYLKRIQEMGLPNQAYVISRINNFIQAREFETSAIKFVELAEKGEFLEAKQLMQRTLRVGIEKEEVGLKYLDRRIPSYYESEEGSNQYLMGTGYDIIDRRLIRGLRRTDFICILGGYKGKKSWGCIHLGKEALMQGLKVLHISHELSLEETEMRYDMSLGGLTSSERIQTIEYEEIDDDGNVISVEPVEVESVWNLQKVQQVRKTLLRFGGELIIRKYPMGSCTMSEIIRYLDYLETYEGFIPDVVINDYIEKMKLPVRDRREHINDMYIQSKGIADERKLLMITVSQVTREALRKRNLSQKDFAEDIRKLGNTDLVLALSQTEIQAQENRMQMYVMANRHGPMDFGCVFSVNLDIGQMCLNCWRLGGRRENTNETNHG